MKRILALSLLLASMNVQSGEIIFNCSWNNNALITITVDPSKMIASRSDGMRDYEVIKISDLAVWWKVEGGRWKVEGGRWKVENSNPSALVIQTVQRKKAVDGKAGKWIDAVLAMTGAASGREMGVCWEK